MNVLIPANCKNQEISTTVEKARDYISNAKASNTKRAYAADWRNFTGWCRQHNLPALPANPDTICLYLTQQASTLRVSTIQRRLAAIGQAHQAAGHDSPASHILVRNLMAGIRREKGVMQRGKAPLFIDDLRKMVLSLSASIAGVRDRAILLIGFAGAFRRSELVSLDVEDVVIEKEGMVINLRRSKTDQEAQGMKKAIPFGINGATCPVLVFKEWLTVSGVANGAIFRGIDRHGTMTGKRLSGKAVALIVKRTAESVGIGPAQFSGHSLRAGLATQASINGASEFSIMSQTGHKSASMVRRYIRDGQLFRDNPAGKVGL